MSLEFTEEAMKKPEELKERGRKYGAPDFEKRNFFRGVVDGRYKLVRWFSPEEYGNPSTLDELLGTSDVALYDLVNHSGELENLAHQDHPSRGLALIERMVAKLHALVQHEVGEDRYPFDLYIFGAREVKYRKAGAQRIRKSRPTAKSLPRDVKTSG
ncbi:hypothetical protein ACO2I3_20735 [Leptospira interrogans]|jgi:arylsulfatase